MTNMLFMVWLCSFMASNCSLEKMTTMQFADYAACDQARQQLMVPIDPKITHENLKYEIRCLPQNIKDYQN